MPVLVQFWCFFLGGLEGKWSVHDTILNNPPCSNNLFTQIIGVVGTGDLTVDGWTAGAGWGPLNSLVYSPAAVFISLLLLSWDCMNIREDQTKQTYGNCSVLNWRQLRTDCFFFLEVYLLLFPRYLAAVLTDALA